MQYEIHEVESASAGGFAPRGAARELWRTRDFETIISGPAETGKTWGCCQYIDALLWKYPGANGVMVRKIYNSLIGSALRTYQRVIGAPNSPIKAFGGERPSWYDYPNGSRLWIIGLDRPEKALSSERDFFYVNQAEELSLNDWEMLCTRATGRGAVMPYTRMLGDCNPSSPQHWIKKRAGLKLLASYHKDNPTLYDDDGKLTQQGKRSMAVLEALTGVRRKRLLEGLWVSAEGMIYEHWNPDIHIIDRFEVPLHWPRYWTIDFGFTNPFTWQLWAQDGDGRLYLLRQIYRSQTLVEDHAKRIRELAMKELPDGLRNHEANFSLVQPQMVICDHDAEGRATLQRHLGISTWPATKDNRCIGIEQVQARLRVAADGKPRLFVFRDSLDDPDPILHGERRPLCLEDEMPGYIWKPKTQSAQADMKNLPDEPIEKDNHGQDALRYLCHQLDYSGFSVPDPDLMEAADREEEQEKNRFETWNERSSSRSAAKGHYGRSEEYE